MHIELATALSVTAFASSLILVLQGKERVFPLVALVASGIELLRQFSILAISSGTFRIDVVVPALLVIAGVACWGKAATKTMQTASTLVLAIGLLQLLSALSVLR